MRYLISAFLVCFVVLAMAAVTRPHINPPGKDEQGLLAMEDEWVNAAGPDVLDRIYAPDFCHIISDGRMASKNAELSYLRKQKAPASTQRPAAQKAHRHFEDMKARIYGDIGVVNGRTVVSDEHGTPIRKTSFTDVFLWRDGRWQAINAQETPLQKQFWDDKPTQ